MLTFDSSSLSIAAPVFAGRVVLVTGGTRGIGRAITDYLGERAATVAAMYCSHDANALDCEEASRRRGRDLTIFKGRVDSLDDCRRIVDSVLERFGRIDVLVNNAGITMDRTVRKMDADAWNAVIDTNLTGAFNMTKAVLEPMIERNYGRIVNVSSVIGVTGNIGQANYAASKAGLFGFTKSLALEVAGKGITVNAVAPGFVGTEMVAAMPEAALANVLARIPVRRLAQPDEIARVVAFLAEEASAYITGAVFAVNGGLA